MLHTFHLFNLEKRVKRVQNTVHSAAVSACNCALATVLLSFLATSRKLTCNHFLYQGINSVLVMETNVACIPWSLCAVCSEELPSIVYLWHRNMMHTQCCSNAILLSCIIGVLSVNLNTFIYTDQP